MKSFMHFFIPEAQILDHRKAQLHICIFYRNKADFKNQPQKKKIKNKN